MDNIRNCKEYQDMMALRQFGELGPEESSELDAHLDVCQACREESGYLLRALEAVQPYVPAQRDVNRAVHAVMDRITPRWKRLLTRRLVPAFVATAAIILAVLFAAELPVLTGKDAKPAHQMVVAQADWDTLNNLDVLPDIDVIENIDTIDKIEQM